MTKALSSSFAGQQGANGCCLIAGPGIDGVVGDGRYLECLPYLRHPDAVQDWLFSQAV